MTFTLMRNRLIFEMSTKMFCISGMFSSFLMLFFEEKKKINYLIVWCIWLNVTRECKIHFFFVIMTNLFLLIFAQLLSVNLIKINLFNKTY